MIKSIDQYKSYKRKYILYRLASHLTFGKMKRRYTQKKREIRKILKDEHEYINGKSPFSKSETNAQITDSRPSIDTPTPAKIAPKPKTEANPTAKSESSEAAPPPPATKIEDHGKNNEIINANPKNHRLHIQIWGERNKIIVQTNKHFVCTITLGWADCPIHDCTVIIGKNTTSNSLLIYLMEDNSSCIIGDDCMFSHQVDIWVSDTHTIVDSEGKVLNMGSSVEIGEHCWVGKCSKILKDTQLPPHSIVGMCSVVTSKITESHSIIVGTPARVVKRGVDWDRRRPQQYLRETGQDSHTIEACGNN